VSVEPNAAPQAKLALRRGTAAMLVRRRELLAQGAEPVGWKIGFNLPAIQEKLGLDAPLAGFLTTDGVLDDGASVPAADGPFVVESEVAVEVGDDGRSVVALLPALELADPPDLEQDVETILAGNVFHRGVAFGPRVETNAPGAALILVNGVEEHAVPAERAGAHLAQMVDAIARRLGDAGESLTPGDRIITGVLAPPHPAEAGDTVRLELEAVGSVELGFT
jgi:2-keto-4-pentenoate hydratase